MANKNQNSSAYKQNVSMVEPLYNERKEVYAWLAKVDGTKTVVRVDWLENYLVRTEKSHPIVRLVSKLGYKRNNGHTNNIYMKPLAQYFKENPRNVPDKIARLLSRHPELVLVALAALFPTMLNIPIFKMLMARKLGV
ncbi:MAG: hypothetical protein V1870_00710 [Candidatus Aenigmatarchaeota archaeon]